MIFNHLNWITGFVCLFVCFLAQILLKAANLKKKKMHPRSSPAWAVGVQSPLPSLSPWFPWVTSKESSRNHWAESSLTYIIFSSVKHRCVICTLVLQKDLGEMSQIGFLEKKNYLGHINRWYLLPETSNYNPWAECGSLPIFVHKVLLTQNHTHF